MAVGSAGRGRSWIGGGAGGGDVGLWCVEWKGLTGRVCVEIVDSRSDLECTVRNLKKLGITGIATWKM